MRGFYKPTYGLQYHRVKLSETNTLQALEGMMVADL